MYENTAVNGRANERVAAQAQAAGKGRNAAMLSLDMRHHKRVDVLIETVFHDQLELDETDAMMSNMSLGGCCIRTLRCPRPGSVISFRCRLPDSDHVIDVDGRVQWVRDPLPDGPAETVIGAIGVMFTRISEQDLQALKRFIEAKAKDEMFR